jgi:tetratricopeptide (TPR) repeat protein
MARFRRRITAHGLAGLLMGLALALCAACSGLGTAARPRPVDAEASAAFEEARAWDRKDDPLARERVREALRRALELEPEWVAPRRLLDVLDTEDLLGLEALAGRRSELATRPDDGALLYLAGRLEGDLGLARFERAARVAPTLSWAQHGLGWAAAKRGDLAGAVRYSEKALALARDPWERSYFVAALARYHVLSDRPREALKVLEQRLADPELAPVDRVELSAQMAGIELTLYFQPEYQRGWERALALLREDDLTESEVEDLVRRMRVFRASDSALLELQLALGARPGVMRDRWRAEILLDQRPSPLALGLLRRAGHGGAVSTGPLLRAARFAAGQFGLGTEEWLADLPRVVLANDGLPADDGLRAVVLAERALEPVPTTEQLHALGDALLGAGWFREARAVAASLAAQDLDTALALEDRAAAGQQLLADLQRLTVGYQSPAPKLAPGAASQPPPLEGLDALLASFVPAVSRAHTLLGGETDLKRLHARLLASPTSGYAGLARIVHPGPTFSAADERGGLGRAGERVGGLAELLEEIGRFGLFGQMSGEDPDGTILARVRVAPRRGEHLGVPWEGTIAWCEGADLKSRAGRLGAEISGAALHEGYWIDIDSIRRERAPWIEFERRFYSERGAERIERALATRGLALATKREQADLRRAERCDATTLLGEGDRLRLAVLADRRARGEKGPGISLDELLEATATHEEAHLCDRTRFLPFSRHLWRAAKLFAKSGMTPEGVARRLEYRAQLVALCDVSDPRVPLVSVLRSAEGGTSGDVTPHGAAYRELLRDLLVTLDRALERDPKAWPELDPDHVLVHQIHLLSPEAVRRVARELAREEGLFER